MKKGNEEHELWREFVAFANAEPRNPGKQLDEAVLRRVEQALHPPLWRVYGKFALVEAAAGLVTLTICPQFGVGFGGHNELLHALHASSPPLLFFLLCGLLFVTLGAALGGLVLNRDEVRAIGRTKHLYCALYSVVAYVALLALGAELFVVSSLAWPAGAMLGNLFGLAAGIRLRRAVG